MLTVLPVVAPPEKVPFTERKYIPTLIFVSSLFMLWAIAITMGDVLNKHFQNVLGVSKARSGLVQFSIFGAYAVMGIPAGLFMKRFGYKMGVLLGLGLYAAGAFLFVPAANAGASAFNFSRGALFVLACGLATLEAVAHPFMAVLGDQRTSDQRLNFAQSFNGLGAVIGPLIGSYFILGGAQSHVSGDLSSVKTLYVAIGSVILVIAVAFSFVKVPALAEAHPAPAPAAPEAGFYSGTAEELPRAKGLFQYQHFRWAWVAQFLNVAAQGGTWAYFINYGVEKMHFTDPAAASYFSLFMVLMMTGRFVGTFLMRYIAPNQLLTIFALANVLMCLGVAQSWGWPSYICLLLINFFFSIMFPTIFSLGIKDLGPYTQQASSILVMAVAGGAVFPYLMGKIANHDIGAAYYLPIICYVFIALFGARLYRLR